MPALFADGFHGDRESFLLIAIHNSAFEHIDALSFRSSACCNEHLLGNIECLGFAQIAFVVYHGNSLLKTGRLLCVTVCW